MLHLQPEIKSLLCSSSPGMMLTDISMLPRPTRARVLMVAVIVLQGSRSNDSQQLGVKLPSMVGGEPGHLQHAFQKEPGRWRDHTGRAEPLPASRHLRERGPSHVGRTRRTQCSAACQLGKCDHPAQVHTIIGAIS